MGSGLLFTIGYQGRTVKALVLRLREAGVTRVIDVRFSPSSPKPGYSGPALRRALEKAGLEYRGLPEVGNPFREEAATDLAGTLRKYRDHLALHPELPRRVLEAADGARAALLCSEANPARCHRSVLTEVVAAVAPEVRVVNL